VAIARIFLDVDGVLADFNKGVADAFGWDEATMYDDWPVGVWSICEAKRLPEPDMWERIDHMGAAFWADLDPYPWVEELWDLCVGTAPTTILTTPSHDPQSYAGKLTWLHKQFGTGFRDVLMGENKAACAAPGKVLIDDRDRNCDTFIAGFPNAPGGDAIVFPQHWNRHHPIVLDREEIRAVHDEGQGHLGLFLPGAAEG